MKLINFDKQAEKDIAKVDAVLRRRIVDGIGGLLKVPPQGDIKQLKGELKGLNRLRVGNWRIIYEETGKSVNILMVLPRGSAYKKGV